MLCEDGVYLRMSRNDFSLKTQFQRFNNSGKIIFQEIWQPYQYDQLKFASKVTAEKGEEVFFLRIHGRRHLSISESVMGTDMRLNDHTGF